ncbi:Ditrans,polycis-undecaprenyl-diphosphate synthase ((2E,6E)-farnesyl-diphosphate specific) [Paraliobacillus sp. PM-2]|uniref:isoprenyl transferase n=1 Tax=Paraliobacillus sp. PM-2 TaxID=1462524 RepID=UPI00061BD5EA|nr:isoprenyl transferase [Paraliobacillus sp. PM-2]CQR47665.1 Ditrans,polycis-undecaprenyl-diphosphate synthase ((2E,6E)-farnesyl-diphosphate specific) [Paraliobacillus sp. PM-2]
MLRLPFLNKMKNKNKEQTHTLDTIYNVPEHIAIIMDGNGRWAKKRGLPRLAGHKQGMDNVRDIVRVANKHGVKILTLYAFSTENWKRPKSEVDYILKLPKEFIHIYLPELIEENVQIKTIGAFDLLPMHTQEAVNEAKKRTEKNDGLILNIALNYGSRHEIIQAIQQITKDVQANTLTLDALDEQLLSKYLYTKDLIDPDLVIRTSGEQRLSNFLLWQVAYAEFWFTDVYWPDFNETVFEKALSDYQNRKRRFGGLSNNKSNKE